MILVKWGLAFCLEVWSVVNGEYLIKDVTRQPTVPTSSGLKSYLITFCDHYSINSFLELWEVCLEFRVALPLHHCLLHHVTADRWLLHCRLQIYRVSSWDSPCLHSCSVQKRSEMERYSQGVNTAAPCVLGQFKTKVLITLQFLG